MFTMGVGHSDDVDPEDALADALQQASSAMHGVEPSAAFLISTHETEPAPLVEAVRTAYPNVDVVGSSSAAEMSSVLGFQEGSVMLALFASDTVDITVGFATGIHDDPVGAAGKAVGVAKAKTPREPRLCIAAPAQQPDPMAVIAGLRRVLGEDVPILGGVSSSSFEAPESAWQFCNDTAAHDGVPVILFSGPLVYSFGVGNGWRPIGKRGRATRVTGDAVQEIDGRPALEFYRRYLGAEGTPSGANPLAVFEDGTDNYYLRAARGYDEATGTILINGGPPQDAEVQIAVAMTDDILEGTKTAVHDALEAFPDGSQVGGAFLFSCMVRRALLGTRTSTEVEIARSELGAALPLCGMYVLGEIAPLRSGTAQYHNETIVALLLGCE